MKFNTLGYTSKDVDLWGNFINIITQKINFHAALEVETLVPLKVYVDTKLYTTSTRLWLWGGTEVSTSGKKVNNVH